MKLLKASTNPIDDLNAIAYEGQPIENRMYKQGYEAYFEMLPVLTDDDKLLELKTKEASGVMNALANELKRDKWTSLLKPLDGKFNRTILAMEPPKLQGIGHKEGAEIVLARWGDGFSSPVHGHADGFLYEQLIFGKMRVNTYRIMNQAERIVRPVETKIYTSFENIAAQYTQTEAHKRSALVHNFTSIGYSGSLHYVPEHTRDGRDNNFEVEHFGDKLWLNSAHDFIQLNARQGIDQLQIGDVVLVRSESVPEYGDHFIVITGKPILKEHGLRPQEVAVHAGGDMAKRILDSKQPIMGLTLLKLSPTLKQEFHYFHDISMHNNKVIFPTV